MKPIWVHNFVLDWDIDLSFFDYIPEDTTKKLKLPEIAKNYLKLFCGRYFPILKCQEQQTEQNKAHKWVPWPKIPHK